MLICRKRASCCPIFLFGRMPGPNDGSHSTFSSNAISVPGSRHTATCGSLAAAKPRVMELLNLVVTSLSSILAGRVATWCRLSSHIEGTPFPLESRDDCPPQEAAAEVHVPDVVPTCQQSRHLITQAFPQMTPDRKRILPILWIARKPNALCRRHDIREHDPS